MQLTIDYKEIEALILAKAGFEITLRASDNKLRQQPWNMDFVRNVGQKDYAGFARPM